MFSPLQESRSEWTGPRRPQWLRQLFTLIALLLLGATAKADEWLPCWHCEGDGQNPAICSFCTGYGYHSCTGCGADGLQSCGTCNGTGWTEGTSSTEPVQCTNCSGSGEHTCWDCAGWGFYGCFHCGTSGISWETCTTCGGHGYLYYPDEGGGSGGGGNDWEPVDPWADVDEYGVGTLGTFELKERADTPQQVESGAEWIGMAVGIFVEPVDWIMTAVEIYRDPTNPWSYIGLIPGVPAGAGKIAKKVISLSTDVLRQLPGGRIIKIGTKDAGMDHILRRHAHGTPGEPNAGKFKQGWHMTQIIDAIEAAIQRSSPQPAGAGKLKFEAELDEVIGMGYNPATGAMAETRRIRIIVSETTGEVITAYPIL